MVAIIAPYQRRRNIGITIRISKLISPGRAVRAVAFDADTSATIAGCRLIDRRMSSVIPKSPAVPPSFEEHECP